MKLDVSTWMMIFFIIFLGISIWKVYAFMPNRVLDDDDTGEESHKQLIEIMLDTIKNHDTVPNLNELHKKMSEHQSFDKKLFWRFNPNKLNQLLNSHYAKNKHLQNIEDIHKELHNE